jgi:hypothetical protein
LREQYGEFSKVVIECNLAGVFGRCSEFEQNTGHQQVLGIMAKLETRRRPCARRSPVGTDH